MDLTPLKTFTSSRPVMYGAPFAAVLGVALGLVFQVGSQTEASDYALAPNRAYAEEDANPIAWPSGKVPDYVIGTDFLAEAPSRQIYQARYEVEPEPVVHAASDYTAPEPAPPVAVAPRPAREETRWASTQGDIMDIRLPEDEPSEPASLN
ncbi:hypothetical protein [Caulobacter sp. DWR1-3-2b1]|uniref:hypothetical protein n=1 Tax=Caulobacter sp. DWR1-3-2b1 TaxID=2804670 RepID=UPI003CF504F7